MCCVVVLQKQCELRSLIRYLYAYLAYIPTLSLRSYIVTATTWHAPFSYGHMMSCSRPIPLPSSNINTRIKYLFIVANCGDPLNITNATVANNSGTPENSTTHYKCNDTYVIPVGNQRGFTVLCDWRTASWGMEKCVGKTIFQYSFLLNFFLHSIYLLVMDLFLETQSVILPCR